MSAEIVPLVGLAPRDVFGEAADLSNAELEHRLLSLAGQIASAQAEFLVYLGAFDLADGWAGWPSLAAWLSYFTAMSITTAREHVRVARALRELPATRQAMLEGRLSFSKVRALSRVAEPVTEAELVQTAQCCSAAQLDRLCGALVPAIGPEQAHQRRAAMSLTTHWDTDGNLVGTFRLPPEDGNVVLAAIERLMPDPITKPTTPATTPSTPAPSFEQIVPAQHELVRQASEQRDCGADAPVEDAAGTSAGRQDPPAGGSCAPGPDRAPDDLSEAATAFGRSRAVGLVELARHSLGSPVTDGLAATSVETVIHVDAAALDAAIVRRRLLQAGLVLAYPTSTRPASTRPTSTRPTSTRPTSSRRASPRRTSWPSVGSRTVPRSPCRRSNGCSATPASAPGAGTSTPTPRTRGPAAPPPARSAAGSGAATTAAAPPAAPASAPCTPTTSSRGGSAVPRP